MFNVRYGINLLIKFKPVSFVRCYIMAQAASRLTPTVQGRVRDGSAHVRFVKDKVALGEYLPEYFDFPCQYHSTIFSYYLCIHVTIIRRAKSWRLGNLQKSGTLDRKLLLFLHSIDGIYNVIFLFDSGKGEWTHTDRQRGFFQRQISVILASKFS